MSEPYYDLDDDFDIIVASFQSQYGIRLSKDLKNMSWREFAYLLSGISGDSPLGRIVSIRAEKDPETLKHMTREEKRIRTAWLTRQAKKKPQKEVDNALEQLKRAFIALAK